MQDDVPNDTTIARIVVTSERLLVADCLTHHFTNASHRFELVADVAEASDPAIPTVCVLDVGRKHYGTPEKSLILTRMLQAAPAARTLVLSSHSDVWEASDWITSGAHGFFTAKSNPDLLTAATIVVAAGGVFVPERLVHELLSRHASGPANA